MILSDNALREFKALYFAHFGVVLSDGEARSEATGIITIAASLRP